MRPATRRILSAGLALVLVACAAVLFHYVPFDAPSYAAWGGIATALVGVASLVKPLRFLAIRSRVRGLQVLLAGVLLAGGAVLWPVPSLRSHGPHKRLDDFMPMYQLSEYHEGRVRAPLPVVLEAARAVSLADMPVAVFLMRLRAMAGGKFRGGGMLDRPILDMMARPGSGFLALDLSDPGELLLGMVGKPWAGERPPRVSNADEFRAFRAPGQIRVAFDIRVTDLGDGTVRVSTETRSLGNDDAARREFARYWRIIYPGSAIIRRVWLDAMIARAEGRARAD